MADVLPPFYYLDNFRFLVAWVAERYADLLDEPETRFITSFHQLDTASQGLLVRMAGRKGTLFRADKLRYDEIGSTVDAAVSLVQHAFIEVDPQLDINDLAGLLTKQELQQVFAHTITENPALARLRKDELTQILVQLHCQSQSPTQRWSRWTGNNIGVLYALRVQPVIDIFLLLFFGNAYQDLTEFVLQDLGILRHEKYAIDPQHRIFKHRNEITDYVRLLELRETLGKLSQPAELMDLAQALPAPYENRLMERRRSKLVNQIAYELERAGELPTAAQLYYTSQLPPARERRVRIYEKQGNILLAWQLLGEILSAPLNEEELQIAERMAPRVLKKMAKMQSEAIPIQLGDKTTSPTKEEYLTLHQTQDELGAYLPVEEIVRRYADCPEAPCFYVENCLLNSLFGLWLWPEMFRSVNGAFANPFQMAPLDLYQENFQTNRDGMKALWALLDNNEHQQHILNQWNEKWGIANHFVSWTALDESLLTLALDCIPAAHLRLIFQRLLFDLKANRSGLPDLIQFFPEQRRYRMIEVKGPGDRIQDNQQRWLKYFATHSIAAEVWYVRWQQ